MDQDGPDRKTGDRDLLFGVVAVELGFLDPAGLMAAAAAWAEAPERGLGEVLAERGLLPPDRVLLVEQMVALRLAKAREDSSATLTGDPGTGSAEGTLPSFGGDVLFSTPMRTGPTPGAVLAESGQVTHEHPGRYTIKGERGRGAIGRVMIAFDEHVGREVALKELLPDRSAFPTGSSPSRSPSRVTAAATSRFLREARITGQLEHPSIVPVYEIARREDGSTYYTMRLVGGRTMADRLKDTRALADRLRLLPNYLDLCQAMAYAHSKDVIHRDLKPANIMLGEFGETVVLDWGLAKVRGLADIRADDLERSLKLIQEASAGETVKGVPIGTPSYMSPEQAEGRIEAVDERSDVWSLGAILYEVLTGHPPFVGQTAWEVMGRVIADAVPAARDEDPAIPAELAAIAAKCLAKDPAGRYQDAAALAEDVAKFQSGGLVSAYEYSMAALARRWVTKRWPVVATAAAALIVLLVFGVWSVKNINKQKDRAVANERTALKQKVAAEQNLELAETREREARKNLAESFLVMGRLLESRMAWRAAELYYAASVRLHDSMVGRHSINYVRTRPEISGAFLATCSGHTDEIWTVAWSPDSSRFVSASEDHTVKVWAADGALLHDLTGHAAKVWAALFSPDGKIIASASADNTVKLWDANRGELLNTLDGHSAAAAGIAFRPDGTGLAVGSWDHTVTYWSVPDGRLLYRFAEATNPVAVSPDGKTLAASNLENNVKLFDLDSGELIHALAGHSDPVYAIAFSPDGRTLATAGGNVLSPNADNAVRLWDTATGELVQTLSGHSLEVRALAFDPGGELLASAGSDETVRLWNVFTGRPLRTLAGHSAGVFWTAFTPDGKYLASASGDQSVKLWDPATGELLATLEGHTNRVNAGAIDPTGALLASAGADAAVKLWNIAPQITRTAALRGHNDSVSRVLFRPDGAVLATASGNMYAGSNDNSIKFWDVETGVLLVSTDYHQAQVCDLCWSPDGNLFASSDTESVIQVLNVEREELVTISDAHDDYVLSLAFSPDGKVLASAGGNIYQTGTDNSIKLWDPLTGNMIRKLEGHGESIFTLEWSPDGKLLASASANLFAEGADNTVKIWDPAGGALLHTLEGHRDSVFHIEFSPDGKLLASCGGDVFAKGNDNAVRLWDPAAGKLVRTLEGHTRAVFDAEFTPDGKLLVTGSDDGTVKVWDTAGGELVRSLEGYKGGVEDAGVSPDGKVIAAGAGDKTVRLTELATGGALHSLAGHTSYVRDLAWGPDGRTLATASDDQTVILWRFDPDTLSGDPAALLDQAEKTSGLKLVGTKLHPFDPATGKISASPAASGM